LIFARSTTFAACPTHTGAPPEEAPHFDLQHYATGDWFGLHNTLYEYGIEITGGYTTEPARNPVGGVEHGSTHELLTWVANWFVPGRSKRSLRRL
jgi:carbohydrate-selective porin OprB